MNSPQEQKTPDAAAPETKIRIDLEYHLSAQRLMIRSQAATIMIEGVINDAVRHAHSANLGGDLPADGIVRVGVVYDMKTDLLELSAQAPRVVVLGVLQHALGAITRNQITQSLQVEREALKARVAALEEKSGSGKILLPGRPS